MVLLPGPPTRVRRTSRRCRPAVASAPVLRRAAEALPCVAEEEEEEAAAAEAAAESLGRPPAPAELLDPPPGPPPRDIDRPPAPRDAAAPRMADKSSFANRRSMRPAQRPPFDTATNAFNRDSRASAPPSTLSRVSSRLSFTKTTSRT